MTPRRGRGLLGSIALGSLIASGACEPQQVEIQLRPERDGTFERTLRILACSNGTLAANAATYYGKPGTSQGPDLVFQGRFREVPRDVGWYEDWFNDGGYVVWSADVGWYGLYHERRTGPADMYAELTTAFDAVDALTHHLADAFRQALKGEKGLRRLARFIETQLRADLKNLLATSLVGGAEAFDADPGTAGSSVLSDEVEGNERMMMLFHQLERMGYLRLQDLPKFNSEESAEWENRWVLGFIAEKMGRAADEPFLRRLETRLDGEEFEKAIEALLSDGELTDVVARWVVLLNEEKHLAASYRLQLPDGATALTTNGQLDVENRQIEWNGVVSLVLADRLCWAEWTVPDAAWQTEHLGSVALVGDSLRDYLVWLEGLPEAQAVTWRKAMDQLAPGPDLETRLREICLDCAETGTAPDSPETGASILLQALRSGQPDQQTE